MELFAGLADRRPLPGRDADNRLAEALGIDQVEMRRRNLLSEGALFIGGNAAAKGVSIGRRWWRSVRR